MGKLLTWKDASSYSRGDTKRIPSILKANVCDFTLIIHRHVHNPETWLLSCHRLSLDNVDLNSDDFEQAENRAFLVLVEHLNKYVKLQDALKSLIPSNL